MQWIVVVLLGALIGRFVYPLIKMLTSIALLNAALEIWNVGNWISEAIASTITLLCFYGAVCLIEAGFKTHGKAERIRFVQQVGVWLIYILCTLLGAYVIYQASLKMTDRTFALLCTAVALFIGAWVLSLVALPDFDFNRVIQGGRVRPIKRRKLSRDSWNSFVWGQDLIRWSDEPQHYLIMGNTGAGKSTFMTMNLSTVTAMVTLNTDCRAILYDPKNTLIPIIEKAGTPMIIMNPLDTRAVAWDICADIVNPVQALALTKILIVDNPDSTDDNFFTRSAQLIVLGVIKVLINRFKRTKERWDLRDVINACESIETLTKILMQLRENHVLLEDLKPGTSGRNDFIITIQTNLQAFAAIASLHHNASQKVSLKTFIHSDDILHLGCDEEMDVLLIPLYGLIIKLLTTLLLSTPPSKNRRTVMFFDEATDGAKHFGGSLVKLLTKGRGYGCSVSLFIQNRAAMIEKFGEQQANQIVGLCRCKAVVGGVDLPTAEWFAEDVIGKNLQTVVTTTQLKKPPIDQISGKRDRTETGVTYTGQERYTVTPHALTDESIPRTSPKTGLTGFFQGGETGKHWHTYTWEDVEQRQIQVDPQSISKDGYQRIPLDSPLYNLQPWTDDERRSLGIFGDSQDFIEEFNNNV
jgi:type IV secretory pathway TraG/TraD family ATPase VirD4